MDLRTMVRLACVALLAAGLAVAPGVGLAACGGTSGGSPGASPSASPPASPPAASPSPSPHAQSVYPGGPEASAIHRDVAYAHDSPLQRLDLYLPATGEPPYPVLVGIHGGGFVSGDKDDRQITPVLQGLERGYAVVALDYRLAPEAPFPAAIADVKAAVRWLRAHATEYGLDSSRIAAWGDSAGGNLAALAGTSGDSNALRGADPADADQSDEVQAVVDWFGPISLSRLDEDFEAEGYDAPGAEGPDSYPSQYLGADVAAVPEKVRAADPITYLTPADPPILIEHGTADGTVPWRQSARLAKAWAAATGKDNVTLNLIEGAGHVDQVFYDPEHVNAVLDWLDAQLK
jgi:acetyl esterase/lipase